MKKTASLVLLILSLAGACVFLACWLAPKAIRHLEHLSLSMRPKYPPLIGESYPEDAAPTEKQKQWALATCAVLTTYNGCSHDVLGGQTDDAEGQKDLLRRWWGVDSRKALLNTLNRIECGGHRTGYDDYVRMVNPLSPEELAQAKYDAAREGRSASNRLAMVLDTRDKLKTAGLAGWDFSRYVSLCGWGFQAGYLTEEEAWLLIMPVARLIQKTFSSWDEVADNYVAGRRFWSLEDSLEDADLIRDIVNFLRWKPYSPWARLEWDVNLLPEDHQDDGAKEFRAGRSRYYGFGNREYFNNTSWTEAVKLFSQAAAKGNIDAMFWLGLCHSAGAGTTKNQVEACSWFQKAAELGDGPAQYELGMCYYWGTGVEHDKKKVAELMTQAVTNGAGPKAEAFLGWCYEQGLGVEKSIAEAVKWYQIAADKGESWAQVNLGELFGRGTDVERDLYKASNWFEKSADGGHTDGMYLWAQCLEKGIGTAKNETEALGWYRKSAKKGNEKAKQRLAEIERPSNPKQLGQDSTETRR